MLSSLDWLSWGHLKSEVRALLPLCRTAALRLRRFLLPCCRLLFFQNFKRRPFWRIIHVLYWHLPLFSCFDSDSVRKSDRLQISYLLLKDVDNLVLLIDSLVLLKTLSAVLRMSCLTGLATFDLFNRVVALILSDELDFRRLAGGVRYVDCRSAVFRVVYTFYLKTLGAPSLLLNRFPTDLVVVVFFRF